jgi:hypothetical protein
MMVLLYINVCWIGAVIHKCPFGDGTVVYIYIHIGVRWMMCANCTFDAARGVRFARVENDCVSRKVVSGMRVKMRVW